MRAVTLDKPVIVASSHAADYIGEYCEDGYELIADYRLAAFNIYARSATLILLSSAISRQHLGSVDIRRFYRVCLFLPTPSNRFRHCDDATSLIRNHYQKARQADGLLRLPYDVIACVARHIIVDAVAHVMISLNEAGAILMTQCPAAVAKAVATPYQHCSARMMHAVMIARGV